jgi:hypothetical protein
MPPTARPASSFCRTTVRMNHCGVAGFIAADVAAVAAEVAPWSRYATDSLILAKVVVR